MGKSIAIRVDVGGKVGTGHWMRDQTLATELARRGHNVVFFSRNHSPNLPPPASAHPVVWLPKVTGQAPQPGHDAPPGMMHPEFLPVTTAEDISDFVSAMRSRGFRGDLLVCDHYGLTFDWYRAIRPEFTSVATIDDLADRRLDTDLLLDQNFYAGLEHRYDGLLPATARKLLGPAYALLRDSFARARTGFNRNSPGERPHHFVVSFGGRELKDCNLPVARCLLRNTNAAVTVLGTPDPANVTAWESLRTLYPGRLAGPIYCQDPATLFTEATAYAGAGGSVTWERCALGLPGIVFAIAENQRSMSRDTADAGFQIYLGDFRDFNESSLMDAVQKLSDKAAYETMVKKMLGLVDGKGVRRVVDELERLVSR